MQFINSLFF